MDFFGVSVTFLLLDPDMLEDKDEPFEVGTLFRFPAVMKGWRIAAWGFMRRSGSQVRHLAMKSMNSSSWHRRT